MSENDDSLSLSRGSSKDAAIWNHKDRLRTDPEYRARFECSSGYCGWNPLTGDPHTCPEKEGQP